MTARHLLSLGAATGALAMAAPAYAQAGPSPEMTYEYAQPSPPAVVYHSQPVVQSAPVAEPEYYEDEYEYVEGAPAPVYAPPTHPPVYTAPAPAPHVMHNGAPMAHGYPGAPYPQHAGWAPPPEWDRDAWLDDCRDRIRGTDRRERGAVIGGLLGAIGGGVIGNRAWRSERLAGTLLGAGVGGLAGLAIGSAIGAAAGRNRRDDCEMYLDRYLSGYGPGYGQGYGYQGYGYAYPAYTMTYVPVMVAVPQRAVVREYVTTEWVDTPAPPRRTVVETKIIRQPAPTKYVPVKTIKTIK